MPRHRITKERGAPASIGARSVEGVTRWGVVCRECGTPGARPPGRRLLGRWLAGATLGRCLVSQDGNRDPKPDSP